MNKPKRFGIKLVHFPAKERHPWLASPIKSLLLNAYELGSACCVLLCFRYCTLLRQLVVTTQISATFKPFCGNSALNIA